ncbi:SWIM zinc finger family protein [Polymorphospora rubra]|uniref:SWIM zinc finger family protein n=1 Tax=Polymorphospora rubra TaxID=338584 RepID=UPI0033D5F442
MSDDRVRGFPAFGRGGRRVRQFAASWWGRAWVRAMEETALDGEQLRRGRRYAYTGHVGSITVSPGRLAAPVYGDDGATYTTVVYVERLADAGWERLADEVAGNAGYLAALLDGEVPHDLVAAADDAGVRLLPDLGDLQPECDCADFEFPCRHAAALCYQASWLLDTDPFVLLLLRGRGRSELLAGLRRRGASRTPAVPQPVAPAGVEAVAAYAAGVPPLPPPPPVAAVGPAGLPVFAPAAGVDPRVLREAVAVAAGRAAALAARPAGGR